MSLCSLLILEINFIVISLLFVKPKDLQNNYFSYLIMMAGNLMYMLVHVKNKLPEKYFVHVI